MEIGDQQIYQDTKDTIRRSINEKMHVYSIDQANSKSSSQLGAKLG